MFAVLPEHGLAQAQQPGRRPAELVEVAAFQIRIERKLQAHAGAGIEATALLQRRVIADAGQGLLIARRPVLPLECAGLLLTLGHVLVAVDAPDERVEALVHLRQRQIDVKAHLRLPASELVPQQRRRDAAGRGPIRRLVLFRSEEAIETRGGTRRELLNALLCLVQPRVILVRPNVVLGWRCVG